MISLLQVVDEQQGPTTKREYDVAKVPVGEELAGKVVDFLGRAPGTQVQLGTSAFAPLLAEQPDMESREQIAEALVTGVKVRVQMSLWNTWHCCFPFSCRGCTLLIEMWQARMCEGPISEEVLCAAGA